MALIPKFRTFIVDELMPFIPLEARIHGGVSGLLEKLRQLEKSQEGLSALCQALYNEYTVIFLANKETFVQAKLTALGIPESDYLHNPAFHRLYPKFEYFLDNFLWYSKQPVKS